MNVNELKAEMVRHNDTCGSLATALGIASVTLSRKLHGASDFTQPEIKTITTRYDLNSDQVMNIFFSKEVS